MTQVNDEKLEKVAGGTENEEYKYIFCVGDFVYTMEDNAMCFVICQNVKTNNASEQIKVRRHSRGEGLSPISEDDFEYKKASRLLDFYREYGGNLQEMK